MNMQPAVQARSSSNGFGRRRIERETGNRMENKLQAGKTNSSRISSGGKGGANDSASRERLVYLSTCLIGHVVEVQVVDGSIFSGIFHAANAEKDFGIVLKMARLIKDGSRGQRNLSDSVSKPPSKSLIIPAKELVQIIAKGVPLANNGFKNELPRDKLQELMTDSYISQSRQADAERQLERWVPDDDTPECPELENIFDGPWNRGWDQFEANETLFGVKSTFNEELYTTKLERGPQMKELEKEALRIAREIEGEDTHDLHLAEERGIQLDVNFELDEETRFSSVFRGIDDSGYDDCEDILLDSQNNETFGRIPDPGVESHIDLPSGKNDDGARVSSRSSSVDDVESSQSSTSREFYQLAFIDHARQPSASPFPEGASSMDNSRFHENRFTEHGDNNYNKGHIEKQTVSEETQPPKYTDSRSSLRLKSESSDKSGLSPNATAYAPSRGLSEGPEKTHPSNELSEGVTSSKVQGIAQSTSSRARPSSSASSSSDYVGAATASTGPGLSPSSSMGSLSSEKSTLNPHAKEFKLNPNAKSFIPSQTPLRPASPVSDGSFYYPANVAAVTHMHGMPVGLGIGPSFATHQPVIFNPQAPPTPQPYFHPNAPQYGQQIIVGHPRQVVYMPTYPPDVPYKGRDF